MNKRRYTCHAVVKGRLVEDTIDATSEKQAWFLFCKDHGYKHYDFKIINTEDIEPQQTNMF